MAQNRAITNSNLKYQNRGLLLKLIATGECVTRIELAKASRMTKMSVTNIVTEFQEGGLVKEGRKESTMAVGRNPASLDIAPNAPKIVGILINREYCSVVLCDLKLQILYEESVEMEESKSGIFLDLLTGLIDRALKRANRVIGIGVASIGPVDIENGMILNPPNFYGIHHIPVAQILQKKYDLPVYLDNQYNSAALAERLYGVGKKYSDFIFVGVTNGIGSGIISEGRLYRSASGLGSELGHTSIDYQGNLCSCGNRGCIETYASIPVVQKRLQEAVGEDWTFEEFCRNAKNPAIDGILMDMAKKLGYSLINSVNLLNPQAVIMGHESVKLPDVYLKQMEQDINEHKLSKSYSRVEMLRASFGKKAQLVGSVCNVLQPVFQGELHLL